MHSLPSIGKNVTVCVFSFADVRRTMRLVRPDVVMVELCARKVFVMYEEDGPSEFRAARLEYENLPGCHLVLGDRDIRITKKRENVIDFREICGHVCWDAKDVLLLMLPAGGRLFSALR